jgi:DNA polymerase
MNKRDEKLKTIRDEVITLKTSPLYSYRIKNNFRPVIGQGDHNADIMFIGEAPGKNEALTGIPFCGAAGKTLDELLSGIDIPRESVYITNIIKDRPENNRDPLPSEIELYGPFLDRQIEVIQPKIIVTLGRFAMNYILDLFDLSLTNEPIGTAHGKQYDATASYGSVIIIPQYHPAAAIYNRDLIKTLKQDFEVIKEVVHSTSYT